MKLLCGNAGVICRPCLVGYLPFPFALRTLTVNCSLESIADLNEIHHIVISTHHIFSTEKRRRNDLYRWSLPNIRMQGGWSFYEGNKEKRNGKRERMMEGIRELCKPDGMMDGNKERMSVVKTEKEKRNTRADPQKCKKILEKGYQWRVWCDGMEVEMEMRYGTIVLCVLFLLLLMIMMSLPNVVHSTEIERMRLIIIAIYLSAWLNSP